MLWIIIAVVAYLSFNVAVWLAVGQGGIVALGVANILGGLLTAIKFRKELKAKPNLKVAAMGAAGILAIVFGLRWSHSVLPVSLSMEAVYNLFALGTWPLFLLLHKWWPKGYPETPNWFDLVCHMAMFVLVVARFYTYGDFQIEFVAAASIFLAIVGYAWFNISIKTAAQLEQGQRRPTNVAMNLIAGTSLVLLSFAIDTPSMVTSTQNLLGLFLGGIAILGIVAALGGAYIHFGGRNQGSLVAPLVYDGLLVASPLVMFITGEGKHVSYWTFVVAILMLVVTIVRYQYHQRK